MTKMTPPTTGPHDQSVPATSPASASAPAEPEGLVVVGVDGSDDGNKALDWAVGFARLTSAKVLLVTAWQWPVSYGASMSWPGYEPDKEARAVVHRAKLSTGLPDALVRAIACEGRPGKVLVDASADAAALVVGSQGHGVIAEAVLGSVSAYCVRRAHCPVVVVR